MAYDKYKIDEGKIQELENTLKYVTGEQKEEILIALDGIFGELEGDAMITKQCAGNPMLSFRTEEHAAVVAERIYNFRQYLQTKKD